MARKRFYRSKFIPNPRWHVSRHSVSLELDIQGKSTQGLCDFAMPGWNWSRSRSANWVGLGCTDSTLHRCVWATNTPLRPATPTESCACKKRRKQIIMNRRNLKCSFVSELCWLRFRSVESGDRPEHVCVSRISEVVIRFEEFPIPFHSNSNHSPLLVCQRLMHVTAIAATT